MRKRMLPSLEVLEDRWVPATIRFTSGTLFISNPTILNGASSISVTQLAANTFQVKNNGSDNGTFGVVSNINIAGTNAKDTVLVDLAGFTYSGALTVNASNGNDTTNLKAAGGQISGNLTILLGGGNDTVSLNRTGSAGSLTVAGTTQITAGSSLGTGNDTLLEGNGSATTTFRGNVNVTGVNKDLISFGQPDVFRGDLNINLASNPNPLDVEATGFTGDPSAGGVGAAPATAISILGTFQVTGGPGDDQVATGFLTIGKNFNVNLQGGGAGMFTGLGNIVGGNDLSVSAQYSGVTTVKGDLNYNSTAALDTVDLSGVNILGNANLRLGQGGNAAIPSGVALDNFGGPTTIGGNLLVTGGNGNFTTAPFAPFGFTTNIEAQIGGDATFIFGNGDNSVTFDATSSLLGRLNYIAGNGANSISVNAPQLYQLNVNVGNGSNTFSANAGVSLTGVLRVGSGTNVFNQNGAVIVGPWYEQGF